MKPRILHLSADYPDQFQPAKTKAISGLVEGTAEEFDHLVISLNRLGGASAWWRPGGVLAACITDRVMAYRYAAPPAILAVEQAMTRLADELAQRLGETGFHPNLIQGHKLTIEGIAAARLAQHIGVPYALTLQGNTDQKLIRHRFDRLHTLRQIWTGASQIMAFAPWTADWCEERLGHRTVPPTIIPCILARDAVIPPVPTPLLIRTAFNLDFWRNKNIATLLAAMQRLSNQYPEARLEIAGSGSRGASHEVQKRIVEAGLSGRVKLVGPISPAHMQKWLNGAAVFALPSRRESFGMVFAEALLAGTPVVFPRGAAIDGYFRNASFARPTDSENANELASALVEMIERNSAIKGQLAIAQAMGHLDFFRRKDVLSKYVTFLERALL